jgi:hypothetical protein
MASVYFVPISVVVPGKRIESTNLHPTTAHFLRSIFIVSTNVRANERHSKLIKLEDSNDGIVNVVPITEVVS